MCISTDMLAMLLCTYSSWSNIQGQQITGLDQYYYIIVLCSDDYPDESTLLVESPISNDDDDEVTELCDTADETM